MQNRLKENGNGEFLTIDTFREYQYGLIDNFLGLIVEYISKQNNNYLELVSKSIKPKLAYQSIFNTNLNQVEVNIRNKNLKEQTSKMFFKLLIPRLIDRCFFIINGNYYIPSLYILDKPIVIKKKSIKLYSLFNSISISLSHDITTFTRANIPLQYMFGLFLETPEELDLYRQLSSIYKIKFKPKQESDVLNYFGNNIGRYTREDIIKFFENLFFDDYTKYLYKMCYPGSFDDNMTLKNILITSLKMRINGEIPNYIDLEHKRLVFIELLMSPLFKRVGSLAAQAARGFFPDELKIDHLQIQKHFLTSPDKKKKGSEGLSGNYLYDTVNLM
ncbi:MAG: hypothetical protein R3250_15955, partial [Melioribacteraceae bacterium]|nr:hypothetical protein [Melioribacteraceae bacterium]